jgi:hypothetical protein
MFEQFDRALFSKSMRNRSLKWVTSGFSSFHGRGHFQYLVTGGLLELISRDFRLTNRNGLYIKREKKDILIGLGRVFEAPKHILHQNSGLKIGKFRPAHNMTYY